MLKRNLKLVQATRSAGAIPIAVNEPILVSYRFNSMGPVIDRHFTGLFTIIQWFNAVGSLGGVWDWITAVCVIKSTV